MSENIGARYNDWSDERATAAQWLTDEKPPRGLVVLGTALADPDVFVARDPLAGKAYWVVKCGGYVCGLEGNVHAIAIEAAEAVETGNTDSTEGESAGRKASPEDPSISSQGS